MEARECNKALSLIAESRMEKLAELDYKRYFINGKARAMAVLKSGFNKIGQAASNLSKGSPEESILIPKPFDQALRKKGWLSVIDQLAFVCLAKLILSLLYKIYKLLNRVCYRVGWAVIFMFRFIYLVLFKVFSPVLKIIYAGLRGSFGLIKSFFRNLFAKKIKPNVISSRQVIIEPGPEPEAYSSSVVSGPSVGYLKPVFVFAGILLLLVLPVKAITYFKAIDGLKGKVLGVSESAIGNLISGGKAAANLDFNKADSSFTLAGDHFITAGLGVNLAANLKNSAKGCNFGLLESFAQGLPTTHLPTREVESTGQVLHQTFSPPD